MSGVRLPAGVSVALVYAPSRSFTGGRREGRTLHLILHPGAAAGSLLSQGAALNSQPANVAKDNGDAGKELFLLPDAGQQRRLQGVTPEPRLISGPSGLAMVVCPHV